ncbi:MAG TPA: polysaccharide deacetylase family protein, partial [Bacteroidales bacterium]|nr:polysaccharide deacetylase family protein [Bacteroidales bacterium]
LSGAQELELFTPDTFHRFPYKSSLQYRLNIADTPVVNEYFEVIRRGIKTFCEKQHLNFRDRRLWGNHQFGALMTHDVDRVNRWTIHETKLRIKQILGFKSSPYSRKQTFRLLLESILRIFQHYENDPYWTFDWIKSIEQEYGVNSTWYFLPQRELHADAYYSFTEERIKNLVDYLSSQGDEVGLHATYASPVNYEVMKQDLEAITTQLNVSPLGIRQHRLSFVYPTTLQIYERLNITYDTSWSFAEHVGWRNSYCLPFKPYDLENDRIMDLWEVPLCLMDKTAFEYQDNGSKGVYSLAVNLVDQAKMYHGMLVLLWHNHYFDEIRFPGIKNLYKEIFNLIEKSDAKWITPGKILQEFESIPLNFSNTVLNISAE